MSQLYDGNFANFRIQANYEFQSGYVFASGFTSSFNDLITAMATIRVGATLNTASGTQRLMLLITPKGNPVDCEIDVVSNLIVFTSALPDCSQTSVRMLISSDASPDPFDYGTGVIYSEQAAPLYASYIQRDAGGECNMNQSQPVKMRVQIPAAYTLKILLLLGFSVIGSSYTSYPGSGSVMVRCKPVSLTPAIAGG